MSKYNELELCERIFGSKFKTDKSGNNVMFSRADLLDKILELQDKLKNAIVPKFKIGQEVFTFIDNDIKCGYIESITKDFNSIMYQIVNYKSKYMSNYFYKKEELLYATREEVEQRLKELRGDK